MKQENHLKALLGVNQQGTGQGCGFINNRCSSDGK
jgi:hypothetical protein